MYISTQKRKKRKELILIDFLTKYSENNKIIPIDCKKTSTKKSQDKSKISSTMPKNDYGKKK